MPMVGNGDLLGDARGERLGERLEHDGKGAGFGDGARILLERRPFGRGCVPAS